MRLKSLETEWSGIQKLWDDAAVEAAKRSKAAEKGEATEREVSEDDNVYSLKDTQFAQFINNGIVNTLKVYLQIKVNMHQSIKLGRA